MKEVSKQVKLLPISIVNSKTNLRQNSYTRDFDDSSKIRFRLVQGSRSRKIIDPKLEYVDISSLEDYRGDNPRKVSLRENSYIGNNRYRPSNMDLSTPY